MSDPFCASEDAAIEHMTTAAAITAHHIAHQGVLRIIKSSTRTGDVSFHSLSQSLQV
jgi:hypothetical protein